MYDTLITGIYLFIIGTITPTFHFYTINTIFIIPFKSMIPTLVVIYLRSRYHHTYFKVLYIYI